MLRLQFEDSSDTWIVKILCLIGIVTSSFLLLGYVQGNKLPDREFVIVTQIIACIMSTTIFLLTKTKPNDKLVQESTKE